MLEKSDEAKFNAIVRKENEKLHLPKKIIDRLHTGVNDETRNKLEQRIDPSVNN